MEIVVSGALVTKSNTCLSRTLDKGMVRTMIRTIFLCNNVGDIGDHVLDITMEYLIMNRLPSRLMTNLQWFCCNCECLYCIHLKTSQLYSCRYKNCECGQTHQGLRGCYDGYCASALYTERIPGRIMYKPTYRLVRMCFKSAKCLESALGRSTRIPYYTYYGVIRPVWQTDVLYGCGAIRILVEDVNGDRFSYVEPCTSTKSRKIKTIVIQLSTILSARVAKENCFHRIV
jgi:hypothetical protein